MSKWEIVKLSEAFDLQMGKTPSRSNIVYWNDGSNKWVSIADISSAEKYIYETKESISDLAVVESGIKIVPKNTVIMSFKLSVGKTCIVPENMYTNEAIMAFVDKGKFKIDKDYIYHLFRGKDWSIGTNKAVKGVTLNKATLSNIEIPLPPLETQKQIARTLDTAAELLAMRKQQLAELDKLIKSIFYDMFGDPVKNEKGWKTGIIKDLAVKIQYGTSKKASLEKLPYPILRMNNITYQGDIDFSNMKYIDLSEKDKEKYLVHKGEMLFNRTNSKELVGKTAVYREEIPMAYAGYLVRLVPKEKANSEFISAYLNSKYGKKLLLKMAKNIVGMANINAQELSNIKIYIPPIKLQNQFAKIVTKIEEQKALVKKAIDETQYLLDSLMSEYFE